MKTFNTASDLQNFLNEEIYSANAILRLEDIYYCRISLPYNEGKLREYIKDFGFKWNAEKKAWEGGSFIDIPIKSMFINFNMKKYIIDLKF